MGVGFAAKVSTFRRLTQKPRAGYFLTYSRCLVSAPDGVIIVRKYRLERLINNSQAFTGSNNNRFAAATRAYYRASVVSPPFESNDLFTIRALRGVAGLFVRKRFPHGTPALIEFLSAACLSALLSGGVTGC